MSEGLVSFQAAPEGEEIWVLVQSVGQDFDGRSFTFTPYLVGLAVGLGQISSYYYVFLILLAPWIARRPFRIGLLIACLGASQIIGLAGWQTDVRFLWLSIVFVALPTALWIARIREHEDPAAAI